MHLRAAVEGQLLRRSVIFEYTDGDYLLRPLQCAVATNKPHRSLLAVPSNVGCVRSCSEKLEGLDDKLAAVKTYLVFMLHALACYRLHGWQEAECQIQTVTSEPVVNINRRAMSTVSAS